MFACTRVTGAAALVGNLVATFPAGVACVNLCAAVVGGGCRPCSDPALVCAREFGGLGGAGFQATFVRPSPVLCPTPGVDGGQAFAGTEPTLPT